MQKRKLGAGNLGVSRLGLVCKGISFAYGPPKDKAEIIIFLRTAAERGVSFFDTAEIYGLLVNEGLVGEARVPFRGNMMIVTKFGFERGAGDRDPWSSLDSHPEHIKKVDFGSLKRLQGEAIYLFYQHRADPELPIEEVTGAVKDLIAECGLEHLGLSETIAGTIRRANAIQPVAAQQSEYSLWWRQFEDEILPLLEMSSGL